MYMQSPASSPAAEKPQNGLAGLKHWRHDLVAGLLVSLISLPFSLGIAIASGAPPIAGIVSAIIAGLLLPFLGGAYVTISGPAAGLAPVLLASMLVLGKGDLKAGYPLLLGVICIAGCVQIVLSLFKAARFSALFPSSVVEGMLASIGLLIMAKQLPNLIGRPFEAHDFFDILREAPSQFVQLNPLVFAIGLFTLVLIFVLSAGKAAWLKILPPQVLAVAVATVVGWGLHLDPAYRIHIPDKPLEHGFAMPNFAELLRNSSLWFAVVTTVITLTLIDGVESLATALAIDKIDPFHRKSNPNRVLLAMGISNICSSIVGGLTIIPGGVKSKACIVGGGRTLWANFYNAIFLLIFLFIARDIINLIPLSALAALLIFTGYKLCEPRVWRHVAHIGREQLLVFSATVAATLYTDLLWGIAFGMLVKLLVNFWFAVSVARQHQATAGSPAARGLKNVVHLTRQFRNPVAKREYSGDACRIYFEGPLVCFNNLHVNKELKRIPAEATRIYLDMTRVALIDHTSCENLFDFVEEHGRNGSAHCEILGMDRMIKRSRFSSCMRLGYAQGEAHREHEEAACVGSAAGGDGWRGAGLEVMASRRAASNPDHLIDGGSELRNPGDNSRTARPAAMPRSQSGGSIARDASYSRPQLRDDLRSSAGTNLPPGDADEGDWCHAQAIDEESWCVADREKGGVNVAIMPEMQTRIADAAWGTPLDHPQDALSADESPERLDLARFSLTRKDRTADNIDAEVRKLSLLPRTDPAESPLDLSVFGLLRRKRG
jgi:MFS superfamily sulfate permease-like transporter